MIYQAIAFATNISDISRHKSLL